jgi:hypothetical protein
MGGKFLAIRERAVWRFGTSPAVMAWMMMFPRAVASTGPARTGIWQAFAVS